MQFSVSLLSALRRLFGSSPSFDQLNSPTFFPFERKKKLPSWPRSVPEVQKSFVVRNSKSGKNWYDHENFIYEFWISFTFAINEIEKRRLFLFRIDCHQLHIIQLTILMRFEKICLFDAKFQNDIQYLTSSSKSDYSP